MKSAEEHQGPSLEEEHAQQALLGASRDDGLWVSSYHLNGFTGGPLRMSWCVRLSGCEEEGFCTFKASLKGFCDMGFRGVGGSRIGF